MSDWTIPQREFERFVQNGVVPAGYGGDPSTATVESVREYLTHRTVRQRKLRAALRSTPSDIILSNTPLTAGEREELDTI